MTREIDYRHSVSGDALLLEYEAARFLNVAPKTLRNMRWRGDGPHFVKVGGRLVRYRLRELEHYVVTNTVGSTSERS